MVILLFITRKQRRLYKRADNSLFEGIWKRTFTEGIIYQLGCGRQKDIETILNEECRYRVQQAQCSGRVIDNFVDFIFTNRLKSIEGRRCQNRCISSRAWSWECILNFVILSQKNRVNLSARLLSELWAGRRVSELQCNTFLRESQNFLGVITTWKDEIGIIGIFVFIDQSVVLLLCIYTQRNISIYYRTQSAI